MANFWEEPTAQTPHRTKKPQIVSHDSAEEHSLEHWLNVRELVEREFVLIEDVEIEAEVFELQA